MKKVMVVVLLGIMVLSSGCASYLVADSSRNKVAHRRAIQAAALPGGGAAIMVNLLDWDVLTEQPMLQLGAAVVDAATLYYGYQGVKSMQDQTNHKDKDTSITVTGNGNNTTVINGDSNSSNGKQDNSQTSD